MAELGLLEELNATAQQLGLAIPETQQIESNVEGRDVSLLDEIKDVGKRIGITSIRQTAPPRTATDYLKDTGVSLAKGVVGAGEAAVGLVDIPTLGLVGNLLARAGYDPKKTREIMDSLYSEAQQEANRKVSEAKGFIPSATAMLENPSTIVQSVAESLPSMVGGQALARGLIKKGLTAGGGLVASAIGEGAVTTGQGAEQVREETGRITPAQAGMSVASGAITGALSLVGGRLAQKFGFSDPDLMLAGIGSTKKQPGVIRRILEGGISEGLFEEMPQSAQEQIWQNAALDKPLLEGVPEQAVQGALTGAAMGGGFNLIPGKKAETPPPPPPVINPVKNLVTEAITAGPGPDRAAAVEKLIPFLMQPPRSGGTAETVIGPVGPAPIPARPYVEGNLPQPDYTPTVIERLRGEQFGLPAEEPATRPTPEVQPSIVENQTPIDRLRVALSGRQGRTYGTAEGFGLTGEEPPKRVMPEVRPSVESNLEQPNFTPTPFERLRETLTNVPGRVREEAPNGLQADTAPEVVRPTPPATEMQASPEGAGVAAPTVAPAPLQPNTPYPGIPGLNYDGPALGGSQHSFTFKEGPKTGASFSTTDLSPESVSAAAEKARPPKQTPIATISTTPEQGSAQGGEVAPAGQERGREVGKREPWQMTREQLQSYPYGRELIESLVASAPNLDEGTFVRVYTDIANQKQRAKGNAIVDVQTLLGVTKKQAAALLENLNPVRTKSIHYEGGETRTGGKTAGITTTAQFLNEEDVARVIYRVRHSALQPKGEEKGTAKRQNPPQVASPLVLEPRVSFKTATGEDVTGKGYALPGFEEYRVVVVPPRGSKAKGTKQGWQAFEQSTGFLLAEPFVHRLPDTAESALSLARQRMERLGKAKIDEALNQKQATTEAPVSEPKPHGFVNIKGKARPFTEWTDITRGPNKGKMVDVVVAGKKYRVARDAVRSWPEAPKPAEVKAEPKRVEKTPTKPETTSGKIEDFGEKIGGARKDTAERGFTKGTTAKKEESGPAWKKRFVAMEKVDGSGWTIGDTKADSFVRMRGTEQTFPTQEEAEKAIPLYAVARQHSVYQNRDNTYSIFKKVSDRKRLKVVNQDFPSREDAMKYMATHAEEILNIKTSFGEEILPVPEKAMRKGAERRTEPATSEMFMETFAPRGIEFGNWNNQEERQQVMNHAYDGLLDLADVLGVPPKSLMLNGELAIAFGARGQGLSGAKAHYEIDYGIINLTKMKGAGSLAHEWFHALDNYFARQDTKASSEKERNERGDLVYKTGSHRTDFLSHGESYKSKLRPELQRAYRTLMEGMYHKGEQYVEDTKKADQFVATAREHLKNELDKIRVELSRDLTNYHKSKGGYSSKSIKYFEPASAEQLAEWDRLTNILVEGGDLETSFRYNNPDESREKERKGMNRSQFGRLMAGRHSNDTLDALNGILKAVRNRTGFNKEGKGNLDFVRSAMKVYAQRLKMFEDATKGTEKTKKIPTSYAIEARKMDQARTSDYWSEPHEMAARAFAAYVEDKIAEQGGQSDFLVYQAHGGILLPMIDGFVARPYPEGKERESINRAFDDFVKTIETRETDKGVQMLDIAMSPSEARTLGRTAQQIKTWLSAVLPKNVIDRTSLELAPILKLRDINPLKAARSIEEHGITADGDRVVLGYAEVNPLNVLIRMSYHFNDDILERTAYHEGFHVAARLLLPESDFRVLTDHYGNEEKAARAFAEWAQGKAREAPPALMIRIFQTLARTLKYLKGKLVGQGLTTPEQVFEKIWGKEYETRMAGTGETSLLFGGERGARDKGPLAKAKQMEAAGVDMEKIRQETGWFRAPWKEGAEGGKWRFEVDDSKASLKKDFFDTSKDPQGNRSWWTRKAELKDVLNHDELFREYPEFKTVPVFIHVREKMPTPAHAMVKDGSIQVYTESFDKAKKFLVHEIQHYIQRYEGHAHGGHADSKGYNLLAGEYESRDAASRMNLTAEQRMAQRPYTSENLKPEDLIVRMEGGKASSVTKKGEGEYVKRILWRGEDEGTGKRTATLGYGLYLSTSKNKAGRYGKPRAFVNAYPKNPLVLKPNETLQDWIFKNTDYRRISDLEKEHGGLSGYLMSKGYYGVVSPGTEEVVNFDPGDVRSFDTLGEAQEYQKTQPAAYLKAEGKSPNSTRPPESGGQQSLEVADRNALLERQKELSRNIDLLEEKKEKGNLDRSAASSLKKMQAEYWEIEKRLFPSSDISLAIPDDPRANAQAARAGNPFGGGTFTNSVDKARETIRPFFNDFMYWVVDKNRPIQSVQSRLRNVSEKLDLFLSETQRPKVTAAKIKEAWEDKIKPLIQKLADAKIELADFEEYAHAKHAHEANVALRHANAKRYIDAILGVVPAKEASDFKEILKDDLYPEEFYAKLNEAFKLFGSNEDVSKIKERWDAFSEKPSGMTDAEATDIIEANKDNEEIEKARKMLLALNNERLDILRDAGVIADEEYDSYKKKYKYYVPLYREGFDDKTRGTGKGITPAGRAVKTRMGSTRNVVNIFANSVSNYENAINRAEKAASAKAFLALVKANPDPDFWSVKEVKKTPKYDSAGNIRMYPNIFEVSPNEIRIMVDGKQYLIEVNRADKDAMLMLKTLKAEDTMGGPLMSGLSKLNRWLSMINTSWSPEFILSNFVRDIQTAGINVRDTGVESKKIIRGALESVRAIYNVERNKRKGTDLEGMYDRFKKAGGKIGWADVHGSIEKLANKISKELDVMSGNRPAYKTISEWMKWVEDANTSIENGIRLHTFRLAVEQGMSDKKAAQIASDLTVDFTKKGAAGPVINSLYLFANAGIQGSYRIIRAGAKSAKVRGIMGGIVGAGFLVGLLNSAIGGSDDDDEDYYNKIDDFVRERNMIFMLPGTKGKYVKIPNPWGYNFFFNLGDEISKIFTKENYKPLSGAARMASVFFGAFNPIQAGTLLQTLSPTVTDPFVQVAENKNWFGGDLMPAENKFDKTPTPDSERYWKSVTAPSKWVASTLNYLTGGNKVRSGGLDVSPETLDLVMDTVGGSTLRFARDVIGTPIRLLSKEEVQMQQIPFLRRVAGEKTEFADSRLYRENVTDILTVKEELKAYAGTDYYKDLLKKFGPEISLIRIAEGYERQLRHLRQARNKQDLLGNKEQAKEIDKTIGSMQQGFNKLVNSKLRVAK